MIQRTEFGFTGSITDLPVGTQPDMGFAAAMVVIHQHEMKEQLAGRLYTVYSKAVGGIAYNGDPLPDWPQFFADPHKKKQVDAWLAVAQAVMDEQKPRTLTPQEIAKGRSSTYYEMTVEEQWAEDKRLGILDWDGK